MQEQEFKYGRDYKVKQTRDKKMWSELWGTDRLARTLYSYWYHDQYLVFKDNFKKLPKIYIGRSILCSRRSNVNSDKEWFAQKSELKEISLAGSFIEILIVRQTPYMGERFSDIKFKVRINLTTKEVSSDFPISDKMYKKDSLFAFKL